MTDEEKHARRAAAGRRRGPLSAEMELHLAAMAREGRSLAQVRGAYLIALLEDAGGSVQRLAKRLGLSEAALLRLMRPGEPRDPPGP